MLDIKSLWAACNRHQQKLENKMKNIVLPVVPLVLSIVLVAIRGVQSTSNVTVYMDDYIRLNQQQFDGVLKEYETILANAKTSYIRELRAIDVQIDLLAVKLEEATERLRPIHLIDSWHKQCVKDNSPDIPLIVTVRTAMSTCSTTALNQLTSYLSNCQSDYNSLKSYYTNTLKNALSNCEKNNSSSQLNYSTCITTTVSLGKYIPYICPNFKK